MKDGISSLQSVLTKYVDRRIYRKFYILRKSRQILQLYHSQKNCTTNIRMHNKPSF